MLPAMRTTVRLRNDLLKRARERAAADGRTLPSLIEEGLVRVLDEPQSRRSRKVTLPVSRARGGVLPGVDLNRSGDLEDLMGST